MDFNKFIKKVQDIILKPKEAFPKLKEEAISWSDLFINYVLILIALPALGNFLLGIRWSASLAIRYLILYYVLMGASFVALMFLMQVLSKNFSGNGDLDQSSKTIAYSMTPAWIASFFTFIPVLGMLISLAGGIYSLYLLYLAVQDFMEVPKDKAVGYEIIFIIVTIVVMAIIGVILGSIFAIGLFSTYRGF